jgi:hypothetical protein
VSGNRNHVMAVLVFVTLKVVRLRGKGREIPGSKEACDCAREVALDLQSRRTSNRGAPDFTSD